MNRSMARKVLIGMIFSVRALAAAHLGDLTEFKKIAQDTLAIVEKGDLKAGKERIRDLETVWDEQESKLQPKDEASWEKADKAIDKALAKLRAPNPQKDAAVTALKTLIATLDELQPTK